MAHDNERLSFPPPHPGRYVRGIKEELDMTVEELATHLGVKRAALSDLINGKSGVSTEMAIRLGQAFKNGARFWMTLQSQYEIWHTEREKQIDVKPLHWSNGEPA
ncbi:MAG: HigA family addiction module antitoxin [Paracoccaceae bacterium]